MVSKRAALARMELEAALLALEELNIGWVEGGWGGGLVEGSVSVRTCVRRTRYFYEKWSMNN